MLADTNKGGGAAGSPLPAHSIDCAMAGFLGAAGARSADTERVYRTALAHFLDYLGGLCHISKTQPTTLLTTTHARSFATWLSRIYRKDGQPLSERSLALYLTVLARFYRYLVANRLSIIDYSDYVNLHDDLAGMASSHPGPIEKRLPGDDLVAALIEAARRAPALPALKDDGSNAAARRRLSLAWRRNLALVLALASSGLRAGEAVALRRGDLEHELHGAWVRGKGGKERFARFSDEAWEAITTYIREREDGSGGVPLADLPVFCRHDKAGDKARKPISVKTVERAIGQLADLAGIGERFNMTPHSLRHYFATHFLRATNDLALTQDALGHADPGTTRVYARTSQEDLVAAHRRIFDRKRGGREDAAT
jgi:site-specific recombinase XerD